MHPIIRKAVVRTKTYEPLIPIDRIDAFLQLEPILLILGTAIVAWLVYRIFLRRVSDERHRNLRKLFSNLGFHIIVCSSLLIAYMYLGSYVESTPAIERLSSYIGLLSLFSGTVVFVKTWRILVFEYLFLGHMRVGVPLLLVNLFTLVFSILLGGWIITDIFNIRLAPLLATSAMFSLVLGLALQDTLGNLFAGVALQLDKPYSIGDWIEVQSGMQKWIGQVTEVTWRATILLGLSDELLTVPNRVMAQAEVSNFTSGRRPFVRSQVFRIPYGTSLERATQVLLESVSRITQVKPVPTPLVMLSEATDSWMSVKIAYFIDDYGAQFIIGDRVLREGLRALEAAGIPVASPRISVIGLPSSPSLPKSG